MIVTSLLEAPTPELAAPGDRGITPSPAALVPIRLPSTRVPTAPEMEMAEPS